MIKMVFYIVAIILAPLSAAGQPSLIWTSLKHEKSGKANYQCTPYGMAAGADGGLFIVGEAAGSALVFKYDPSAGQVVWEQRLGGSFDTTSTLNGCHADQSGVLFTTGGAREGTSFDATVSRFDGTSGVCLWTRKYDFGGGAGDIAGPCDLDPSGYIYLAGTIVNDTSMWGDELGRRIFAAKCDPATGDTIWVSRWTAPEDTFSEAGGCAADSAGNLYVAGFSQHGPNGEYGELILMKHDAASGDAIWTRRFDLDWGTEINGCTVDESGYVFAVGSTGTSSRIFKFDPANGDTVWTRSLEGSEYGSACCLDGEGHLVAVGVDNSSCLSYITTKIDCATGDTLWLRSFTGSYAKGPPFACVVTPSGHVFIAGDGSQESYDTLQGRNCLLVNYGPDGSNESASKVYLEPVSYTSIRGCAAGPAGSLYTVGCSNRLFSVASIRASDGGPVWMTSFKYNDWMLSNRDFGGNAVAVDQSGAPMAVGYFVGDLYSMKSDPTSGDSLWLQCIPYSYNVGGVDCAIDRQGYLIQSAWSRDYDHCGHIVVKTNATTGDTIWKRDFGDFAWQLRIRSCTVDTAGYPLFIGDGLSNVSFLKCNPANGDTIWFKELILDSMGAEYISDLACDKSNRLYGTGHRHYDGNNDILVVRLDPETGDTVWVRTYCSPIQDDDRALGCAVDDSGNLYVTGCSYNGSDYDWLTVKFDQSGDTAWSVRYDGAAGANDMAYSCAVDGLGYLYVSGFTGTGRGYDALVIKYDTGHTGVGGETGLATLLPRQELLSARPNPARDRVWLTYCLEGERLIRLEVYNVQGQLVRVIEEGVREAGGHRASWDCRDARGSRVSSGIYLVRLSVNQEKIIGRMLVLR